MEAITNSPQTIKTSSLVTEAEIPEKPFFSSFTEEQEKRFWTALQQDFSRMIQKDLEKKKKLAREMRNSHG